MDPTYAPVHLALGDAYVRKTMYQEAIHEFREGDRLSGAKELLPENLEQGRTLSDYQRTLRWQLEVTKRRAKEPGFWQYHALAALYARLGEKDLAFAALNAAIQQHDPLVIFLKGGDASYDNLLSDPRMGAFLHRMGLSQ